MTFSMRFSGMALALAVSAYGVIPAGAETGVTIGAVHIEPAFGAPTKPNSGAATTQTEVVEDQALSPMLTSNSDVLMQAALDRYASIVSRGGFPKVPSGTYKKGAKGDGVAALNQYLFMAGYLRAEGANGDFAAIFTSATEDSVRRFQRNLGLNVSGKVDKATLAELNVSAQDRLATIRANLPRLAIYDKALGNRYLVVNVPAQQIETVNDGHVYSRHNAIVGRPERPSPVVMTPIAQVKFNPYWNAPVSIIERDIIPKLKSGTQILTDMEMKVFKGVGGPEIDPKTVDWSTAIADDYAMRQEPGPKNAMATAKIEFNSPFGIYLHDTSEPGLFKTSNRFYSSGCIRVDKMPLLVQWVLNGQDGFGESKIATMAETLEQLDVPLVDAPQLRVAYLTAWPASKTTVAFRHDVYDLDGSGFTVGQPMPVGELSPDGERFVLKPLPRQVPVDAAEAEGFNLFRLGSKSKSGTSPFQKSLFGKPLLTSEGKAPKSKGLFASNADTVPEAPFKQEKTKVAKGKKFSGLFDWETYRKEQAQAASGSKVKKVKIAKKPLKVKAPANAISIADIPPEPKVDMPKPKKLSVKPQPAKAAPASKPVACTAGADGKLPAGCKPVMASVAKP
jgi:L,D-transpeptidase YcbB